MLNDAYCPKLTDGNLNKFQWFLVNQHFLTSLIAVKTIASHRMQHIGLVTVDQTRYYRVINLVMSSKMLSVLEGEKSKGRENSSWLCTS